jgi:hypothetical protein
MNAYGLKISAAILAALMFAAIYPAVARAGFLDRLTQANNAVQQFKSAGQTASQVHSAMKTSRASGNAAGQNQDQGGPSQNFELTKTDNPIKGTWGTQVTCVGNSATCANGMDNIANCMHQGKGYYYRLVADNLQKKLETGDFEGDRAQFQADVKSVEEAIDSGNNPVDADPNDQQRWLHRLTRDDQQSIQKLNSKYMNEVRVDCDQRFGGMAQYSGGN